MHFKHNFIFIIIFFLSVENDPVHTFFTLDFFDGFPDKFFFDRFEGLLILKNIFVKKYIKNIFHIQNYDHYLSTTFGWLIRSDAA